MTTTRPDDVPLPMRMTHLPRDDRGFPIIAAVPQHPGEVDFGALSESRKLALATFDLCAVCARPFRDELRWQVALGDHEADPQVTRFNEAPVHKVCALYAAQVCPFVSSPYARLGDQWRKGTRRPDVVRLLGFDATTDVAGVPSELQPGENILFFGMGRLIETDELRNKVDADREFALAMNADEQVDLDPAEQQLVTVLCSPTIEGEDSGPVMAGAAWMIGACWCADIARVQGQSRFVDGPHEAIALMSLQRPNDLADGSYTEAAGAAAFEWLASRDELPPVLTAWRRSGRDRRSLARKAPNGPATERSRFTASKDAKARRAGKKKGKRR